jgi:acetolactate synthase-1/2/3 large subunit
MLSDGEERQRGPQEVAIAPLVDRITKHSMLSFGGDYLRGDMEYLYRKAMEAPWGPVWYDIPLDVQGAKI